MYPASEPKCDKIKANTIAMVMYCGGALNTMERIRMMNSPEPPATPIPIMTRIHSPMVEIVESFQLDECISSGSRQN